MDAKAEANQRRAESCRKAWKEGKGKLAGKLRVSKPCACGCGEMTTPGRTYILNHNMRGKQHDAAWVENQVSGLKRAWKDASKFVSVRNPSRELIEKRISPLRGTKRPEEVGSKISAALKGRKLSPEHRAVAVANLRQSGSGFKPGQRPALSPEAEERRLKNAAEALRARMSGSHGFGRAARDRKDHCKAMHWIVRAPNGVIYEFDNLQSWARANVSLLLPDMAPASKLPLWYRFVLGMNNLQRTDGKGGHSWRGWTLVSVMERREQGAPDLINRKPI